MEINVSKESESSRRSSRSRSRKGSQRPPVNLSTLISVSRTGTKDSLPVTRRDVNELVRGKMEEKRGTRRLRTLFQPVQRVTTPYKRIKNWQPDMQTEVLRRKAMDTSAMPKSDSSKITPSPRPMIDQFIHDIPSGMQTPSWQMRSVSCAIPKQTTVSEKAFQQPNLVDKRKTVKATIERQVLYLLNPKMS